MANENEAKLKALKLTLDKLDKTYGKGAVMKMGDSVIEDVEVISSGSLGLDLALGVGGCLLYTSPSPRDRTRSRMPSSA